MSAPDDLAAALDELIADNLAMHQRMLGLRAAVAADKGYGAALEWTPRRLAPVLTRAEAEAIRGRLEAEGRPAGYRSIAKEALCDPSTVRRALGVLEPRRSAPVSKHRHNRRRSERGIH